MPREALTKKDYDELMKGRTRNLTDNQWLRQPARGAAPLVPVMPQMRANENGDTRYVDDDL